MPVINQIKQDIFLLNGAQIDDFQLIREKWGVHVYRCKYEGSPAVVKYFENEGDKREIKNYHILNAHNIPTIHVFAYGKSSVVMEDISVSDDWRLGTEEDLHDTNAAESLADWYFILHENGLTVPELNSLESEFDAITEANLQMLCEKLPEAADTFNYILPRFDKLRRLIDMPSYTLTYNDFYWSNFIVRKDKREAVMFDYNLLGRGYRYSDLRNVRWSLSEEAKTAFTDKYNRLYADKYGADRTAEEVIEKQIDDVADDLHGLCWAFERNNFSHTKEFEKNESADKSLLKKAKKLLE
jgi:hypothetical protein